MAEEYHQQQSNIRSQNWWSNNNSSNRYESESGSADDPLVGHNMNKVEMIRLEDSVSISGSSSTMVFPHSNLKMPGTLHGSISSSRDDDGAGGNLLVDTNLQHMGLGLSSQGVDWDQALLRGGGKADQSSSFRSMLEEDHISSSANFQQEIQWKPNKIFTSHGGGEESSLLGRSGFSLEQPQFSSPNDQENSSTITCHNLPGSYIENSPSVLYGGSPSSMLQSFLGSNNNNQPQQQQQQQAFFDQRGMDQADHYSYIGNANYGMNSNESSQFMPPSSFSISDNNKFPDQFMRNSPPKVQQQQPLSSQNHLQFSNNAPYWNASSSAMVVPADIRASFMPASLQPQFPTSSRSNSSFVDEKPKNNVKEGNKESSSVAAKKSGTEASTKRPRNESSPSTLPPFKVKKEKMGDRITTLQQLVSPFGKTDTASVLSESIEYIKILHEQVLVLTAPYIKHGAMMQQHHHQHLEKSSSRVDNTKQGPKQDLRSRGLCLVPLSSTFPITNETSVDFWTPTFGGPLR